MLQRSLSAEHFLTCSHTYMSQKLYTRPRSTCVLLSVSCWLLKAGSGLDRELLFNTLTPCASCCAYQTGTGERCLQGLAACDHSAVCWAMLHPDCRQAQALVHVLNPKPSGETAAHMLHSAGRQTWLPDREGMAQASSKEWGAARPPAFRLLPAVGF